MDALITIANVLNLSGFFVKDRVWVRALSLVAAACAGIYLTLRPAPFAYALYWNAAFVALHAYFLARLVAERKQAPADSHACGSEHSKCVAA